MNWAGGVIEVLTRALAGRYEVERELGSGAMATVYLAFDVRHGRRVAVKVLRPDLAAALGAERFLQEIQVTANLTHPHILSLHDSGEAEGHLFYVMPYVEGETLRDRLERERELPIEESLRLVGALAGALDYAHRQGIVHRDIKPRNILLQDGQPLIADFGIALAISAAAGDRLTSTGLSIGTPQYMSPEQATADRPVDGRTDVYALACILYEMLAGEPPFMARNARALLARKLTDTAPDISAVRETVPTPIAQAVRRALSRTPADRYDTAEAFARALDVPAGATYSARPVDPVREETETSRSRVWQASMILLAMVAGASAAYGWGSTGNDLPPVLLSVPQGEGVPAVDHLGPMVEVSRDGSRIAYLANDSVGRRLYVKAMAEPAQLVPGSDGAMGATFSPDGRYVAYFLEDQVRRFEFEAGRSVTIGPFSGAILGASWTDDGRLVFTNGYRQGLMSMSTGSGEMVELTTVPPVDSDRLPQVVPGTTRLIYHSYVGQDGVWTLDTVTGEQKPVVPGTEPRYADGYVFYRRGNTLYGQRFDAKTGSVAGDAAPLHTGVSRHYAISETGTLVYAPAPTEEESRLVRLGPNGERRDVTSAVSRFIGPAISPDGTRVAVGRGRGLYLYDLRSGGEERIAPTITGPPIWSPDGRALIYATDLHTLRRFDLASRSEEDLYTTAAAAADVIPLAWTPEGALLFSMTVGDSTDLQLVGRDGDVNPVGRVSGQVRTGDISPDGSRIVFPMSPSMDDHRIQLGSFPDIGALIPISRPGASDPHWSADGRSIYFVERGELIEVPIGEGGNPVLTDRRTIATIGNRQLRILGSFDVHPDGESFVVVLPLPAPASQLIVVTGWLDSVRDQIR